MIEHKVRMINVKKRTSWKCQFLQKSAKSPVSYINWVHFFILFSHGFTWKLTVKKGKFCGKFLEKVRFFGKVPWNCDIGLNVETVRFGRKKIETVGTRLRRVPTVSIFFRPNWQFQHLSQITVSWNLPKNWPFSKTATKTALFTVSFKWNRRKKKEPSFLIKTISVSWNCHTK